MSDRDAGGRLYHLRPRLLPAQPPGAQIIPLRPRAPAPLATVHVFPPALRAKPPSTERVVDGRTVLDWAWAVHQRVYPGGTERGSYLTVHTGAERGRASELFASRVAVRALPDCEEWIETLQLDGRALLEVFESTTEFTPAPDGHDCDCTCEGGPEHGTWTVLPAAWRPVRPGALLQKLARGFELKVRLAAD